MNNYTDEQIAIMENEFCSLLLTVNREHANINGLIDKLKTNGFFESPASTKYHNAFRGGLVEHSLNVYHNLKDLVHMKGLENEISEDSIIICGLLHDFSKMGMYEATSKNKKVYSPTGSKYDELGKFDWVAEMGYATKDSKDRFIYGNHEETSEFMIRNYIPLKVEESIAILYHHAGMSFDSTKMDVGAIYGTYKLPVLLHTADMLSAFVDEGR